MSVCVCTFLEFYCLRLYGSVLRTLSSKSFHIVEVYSMDYIAVYNLYTRILPCAANVVQSCIIIDSAKFFAYLSGSG